MRTVALAPKVISEMTAYIVAEGGCFDFIARGSSMVPAIRDGDSVSMIAAAADNLQAGDIVLYKRGHNHLVLHRIIEVQKQQHPLIFTIAGDKSPGITETVEAGQIIAKVKVIKTRSLTYNLKKRIAQLLK